MQNPLNVGTAAAQTNDAPSTLPRVVAPAWNAAAVPTSHPVATAHAKRRGAP
jgi:hypothetical protein